MFSGSKDLPELSFTTRGFPPLGFAVRSLAMAGQDASNASLFTESEVEFLAEDEMINIIPNVRMATLHMICGDFGPFRPQIPVTVPLWLGIAMKKRSKCRIQPPDWMSVERLTEVLEMERDAPREFQPLPFHYVEIARLLLDNAREDIENNFMVQSLLEDIKDVRWDKVEKGLKTLSGRTHAVKLKNLSAMEVNRMRNFTVRALQAFYKHDSEDLVRQSAVDNDSQLTSTPSDRLPRVILKPHRYQVTDLLFGYDSGHFDPGDNLVKRCNQRILLPKEGILRSVFQAFKLPQQMLPAARSLNSAEELYKLDTKKLEHFHKSLAGKEIFEVVQRT